ncbi:hypothetical protein FCH28_21310 [Streptomyces piniterrae]|uniref:Uncharacterized protein n=1 Tax=Streptomyces piniterrae TaxID=2571125 RepID=A0A4V5MJX3_9ACTN|nr:hypothetical protein [Streptomyces piniterrae]TJZ51038.1 hypothetical protein FCH28_21310 [Streptomyces piniterrae]
MSRTNEPSPAPYGGSAAGFPAAPADPAAAPSRTPDAATEAAARKRKLPKSPVKKPSWDAWSAGKSAGMILLMLPVLLVVGFFAQILEALYYAAVCVFYVVTSPYWITRTLWRALRPVETAEHAARRKEAREVISGTTKGCGCVLAVLAIPAVIFVVVALVKY